MAGSLHLLGCQLVRAFAGNQDQPTIRKSDGGGEAAGVAHPIAPHRVWL